MISSNIFLKGSVWLTCTWLLLVAFNPQSALAQSSLPSSLPSEQIPNRNNSPTGIDPLQVAPNSQVDQLQQNQSLPQNGNNNADLTESLVRDALLNTANRYPWIIDPTDRFSFPSVQFRPTVKNFYTNFDLQFAKGSPVINRFTAGDFADEDSFYWVLDDNRVVMETEGRLAGVLYQGRSNDITVRRKARQIQSYGGNQYVVALPPDLDQLMRKEENGTNQISNTSVLTVTAEIINPPGIPAPPVKINNPATNSNNSNITSVKFPNQNNLFDNIEVANAPLVLQAFPTTNLQPLAQTALLEGEEVSEDLLKEAGIEFGSVLQGISPTFTPQTTSTPGIKILQLKEFGNYDLLKVLLDRSLSEKSKTLHYLNSLLWVSYGIRAENQTEKIDREQYNWYRIYASKPHHRVLVRYDPKVIEAKYTDVFANPGISLTLNQDGLKVDEPQTLAASFGLLAGGVFDFFNPENVDQSLKTARERYQRHEIFTPLQTKATSEQRRAINRRLNSTLAFANRASGLTQLSGLLTFPSAIHTDDSSLFQVRTGLYQRSVLFIDRPPPKVTKGPIQFGELRLSIDNFGPLGFTNTFVPNSKLADNESFAVQSLVTTSDDKKFLFSDSSDRLVGVPLATKASSLAFDRFELTRTESLKADIHVYSGALLLPAAEMVFSGTQGNWNYSLSAGAWLNPTPNRAMNALDNGFGLQEPTLGLYSNALVSYTDINVSRDAKGNFQRAIINNPSLNLRWNSAPNSQNPITGVLQHSFSYQDKNLALTLAPGLVYSDRFSVILPASFNLSSGLSLNAVAELGQSTYYSIEGLQSIGQNLAIGSYFQNYTSVANSRILGNSYGLKLRYTPSGTPLSTDLSIGTSENGFETRIQGNLSF